MILYPKNLLTLSASGVTEVPNHPLFSSGGKVFQILSFLLMTNLIILVKILCQLFYKFLETKKLLLYLLMLPIIISNHLVLASPNNA